MPKPTLLRSCIKVHLTEEKCTQAQQRENLAANSSPVGSVTGFISTGCTSKPPCNTGKSLTRIPLRDLDLATASTLLRDRRAPESAGIVTRQLSTSSLAYRSLANARCSFGDGPWTKKAKGRCGSVWSRDPRTSCVGRAGRAGSITSRRRKTGASLSLSARSATQFKLQLALL